MDETDTKPQAGMRPSLPQKS